MTGTRFDAVIFDLDGTLLDHASAAREAVETWVPTLGVPVTAEAVDAWFTIEETHFARWRNGEIPFVEQRRARIRDFFALLEIDCGDEARIDTHYDGYAAAYAASWRPFPDALAAVADVRGRGLRLGLLTNGNEEMQLAKLRSIGLAHAFDVIHTAGGLGLAKPHPDAYLRTASALGVEAERCVHIGDSFELDVRAPRELRMGAIFVDRAGAGPEDDARIRTLAELGSLLGDD